ncbi:MAG: hypothetical protein M1816_008107 [Peltula sp. TS41687]|nr:MAG: hypothetical protein M1816_008107 [Peltula sp. TS41687]
MSIGGTLVGAAGLESKPFLLQSSLERLARRGEILMDHRPPPLVRELQRRQLQSTIVQPTRSAMRDSTSIEPPSATSGSSTSSLEPSTSSTMTSDPGTETPSPPPRPFDTSLGANFTSTNCPNFFQQFLGNPEFSACLPFSLLLQNSHSFFQAEKSRVRITQALDATCNVDFNACSILMSRIAQEIRKQSTCGPDYNDQNSLVMQAYKGLISYEPLYRAGCLKSTTGSYCTSQGKGISNMGLMTDWDIDSGFADAITNMSSPSDSYTYFLPLGLSLPGGSRPASCTSCLQNTMSIFANAASNVSQPAHRNYVETAQLINLSCGPDFVNSTIPPAKGSASSSVLLTGHMSFSGLVMLVALVSSVAASWLS